MDPLANKEDSSNNQSKFPSKSNKKPASMTALWKNKTAFQKGRLRASAPSELPDQNNKLKDSDNDEESTSPKCEFPFLNIKISLKYRYVFNVNAYSTRLQSEKESKPFVRLKVW